MCNYYESLLLKLDQLQRRINLASGPNNSIERKILLKSKKDIEEQIFHLIQSEFEGSVNLDDSEAA